MKTKFLLALVVLPLGGCSSMQTLPDMRASAAWEGRPVTEVVDQFGPPHRIETVVDKQWVVLVYPRATGRTSREALGATTAPQNGQMVHTEYYGDVTTRSSCDVRIAVNRARQVAHVSTQGGFCGSVDITPKR